MPTRTSTKSTVVWTIRGVAGGRGGGGRSAAAQPPRYVVSGSGAEPEVTVAGNTISIKGHSADRALRARQKSAFVPNVATGTPTSISWIARRGPCRSTGIRSPEVDLSTHEEEGRAIPRRVRRIPLAGDSARQDVACSVITALGDKFDFIASYSDFRVDNPEGGTPSTGPRGGNVSGIGTNTNGLENYCSQGATAVDVRRAGIDVGGADPGALARRAHDGLQLRDVADRPRARTPVGGRRARDRERRNDHARPGALGGGRPSSRRRFRTRIPVEADAMGGSTWKDNGDGTYTQLDRDYYSPAKGWSWLALYLMGLAKPEEVPPFFILRNLQRTGQSDADGHPIYKGDKTVITIQDVIAAMGPRVPDFDHAQKKFNTAIVVMTMPGKAPTKELISAANNISEHWIAYWSKTTNGGRR